MAEVFRPPNVASVNPLGTATSFCCFSVPQNDVPVPVMAEVFRPLNVASVNPLGTGSAFCCYQLSFMTVCSAESLLYGFICKIILLHFHIFGNSLSGRNFREFRYGNPKRTLYVWQRCRRHGSSVYMLKVYTCLFKHNIDLFYLSGIFDLRSRPGGSFRFTKIPKCIPFETVWGCPKF